MYDIRLRPATENDIPFMVSMFIGLQPTIPSVFAETRTQSVTRMISLWLEWCWIVRCGGQDVGFTVIDLGYATSHASGEVVGEAEIVSYMEKRVAEVNAPGSPDAEALFKRIGLIMKMQRHPWLTRLGVIDAP